MARIASTTTAGVDIPGSGMTLDALMARQKALADAQGQIAAPRNIQSPWQGAAQLAQSFFGARQEAGLADQLGQGRAALAQIMSGIDPATGPTQAQLAQAYQLDPDLSVRLMEQAQQARREKALREQELADRAEGRTYAEGQTAATRTFETGREATIDSREQVQAIEAEKRAAASRLAEATGTETRARVAAEAERTATPDTTLGKLQADLKEGRIDQATYDAAVAKEIAPSSSGVTINTGDTSSALRKKFDEKEGERWDTYVAAGDKAAGLTADMQLMDELGKIAPQGPLPGAFQKMFPGVNSAGAAFQSVVKRLAPQMRAIGSGATSDLEYNGMLESLPRLGNYPEANALISGMMKAKAQIDVQRADVITAWRNGDIEDAVARTQLNALNRTSIMTPELRALIAATAPEGGAAGGAGDLTGMSDEELDAEIARRRATGGQ